MSESTSEPIQPGDLLPPFEAAASGADTGTVSRDSLRGRWVLLYFYPKDETPGCTKESQNFRDLYGEFQALGCDIIGVSKDTADSHEKFRANHSLPFPLIADTDSTLCDLFGVIGEKKFYGRISIGLQRSSFLIDDRGVVRDSWRRIRVAGHAERVLQKLRELKQPG